MAGDRSQPEWVAISSGWRERWTAGAESGILCGEVLENGIVSV
jgi:hypothetical protein